MIADLGEVAPELPEFLRDLRPVAQDAMPVLADLRTAISKPGSDNDLTDSLKDLPAVERAARTAVPVTVDALADSQHIFEFARPYMPDLVASISKLGRVPASTTSTGISSALRPPARTCSSTTRPPRTSTAIPRAVRSSTPTPRFGDQPKRRCPGGATQPNAGWPAPEDHPFLADGELAGECDPTDVPPGP